MKVRTVKVTGKRGDYLVSWEKCGFSFAELKVYKPVKFKILWWTFETKEYVWTYECSPVFWTRAIKMHPKTLKSYAEWGVKQYEDYLEAWNE